MRKFTLAALLIYMTMMTPVFAQTQDKHATGDMYTKALNMMAARGLLDTLEPKKRVTITNITMDHGQVFVAMSGDNGSITMVYDPIANKILYEGKEVE